MVDLRELDDVQLYDYVEELVYMNPFLADKLLNHLQSAFMDLNKKLDKIIVEKLDEQRSN